MLITLAPGGTGKREKVALQIQEVAPTDSRGGGVALCSMWHFALRVDTGGSPTDLRGGPTDSRGGPHHVCGVPLCSVWHFLVELNSRETPVDRCVSAVDCNLSIDICLLSTDCLDLLHHKASVSSSF